MKLDPMFAIFNLGGGEIILVLAGVLLLFGGKKLPELAKGLGQGIKEFKKASGNASEEIRHALEDPMPAPARRLPAASADAEAIVSSQALISDWPGPTYKYQMLIL